MLRTVETENKMVKFDSKVYEDLGLLAQNSNRTIDELINLMSKALLQDNKQYFIRYILTDILCLFLSGDIEKDSCKIANIEVELECVDVDDGTQCKLHCINRDTDDSVIEDYERVYDADSTVDMDALKKELENIAYLYIDRNHDDVKNYLKHRMDYR